MALTVIYFGARVTARLLDKEIAAALLALSMRFIYYGSVKISAQTTVDGQGSSYIHDQSPCPSAPRPVDSALLVSPAEDEITMTLPGSKWRER